MKIRNGLLLLAAAAFSVTAASCFSPSSTACESGLVCPVGTVCSGDGTNCIAPSATCGNGVRDEGEACDDGNVVNDMTCRADCKGTGA
ncbi:MAG TPA: hypothetical protein VGE37_12645, partial [Archangium sp.]